jgi:hypothetical protein
LPPGFPAVLKYVESHGYDIEPYGDATSDYYHQNIIVVNLVHSVTHKAVNVMTSLDNHVVKAITRFHSTLVMNYVTWFGQVVLYPDWTLKKRGLVVIDTAISESEWLTQDTRFTVMSLN